MATSDPVLRKSHSISLDLFQIMHDTEQVPLSVDLSLGPQGKPVQAESIPNVGKGWFSDGHPYAVNDPADRGVDFSLHLFGKSIFAFFGPAIKVSNLPTFCFLRLSQTLSAKLTRDTGRLGPFKSRR